MNRRNFLRLSLGSGLTALGASAAYAQSTFDTGNTQLEEITIKIPGLAPSFSGYRVGFLSDLHLNFCTPPEWVRDAIKMVESAKPDLLLLGGDYIWIMDEIIAQTALSFSAQKLCFLQRDTLAQQIYPLIADMISNIKPPDGIYAVLGNHDHWVAPDLCRSSFEERGIKTILNDTFTIQRSTGESLRLIGCDDYWTGVPKLPVLPKEKSERETRIIFTHNPDLLSWILEHTDFDFDLGVAGHTHGGQIKLPGIGALFYNVQDLRFAEGLYQHPKAQIYTSRGVGVVGIPVRINCPPEVSVFNLLRA